MRLTTILVLVCAFSAFAETTLSQNAKVTIRKNNVSLEDIFNEIESQTDYLFVYNVQIDADRRVTLDVDSKPVSQVLATLFNRTEVVYSMEGSHIILSKKKEEQPVVIPAPQQSHIVTGIVLDDIGEPVIGANIVEKGTTNGTITDLDGKFSLEVPGTAILQITYVGYVQQEVAVNNQSMLNIRLLEDMQGLEEIVVIGYGVMKKRDLTGSVASVDSKKLATVPTGNPLEALQGKIAGVDIGSTTEPGGDPKITIRGNRSINANNDPLYVVDGIPRNTISDIAVADIESIEVLKDAASTAIYGSRGANGVILLTTKRGGVNQPTQVSFSAYMGINDPAMHKMMNGEEYIQLRRDAARMNQTGGWSNGYPSDETIFFDNEKKTIANGNYVDWQDLLFRSGINQEYNLSVSQGSEKTQMMINLGYRFEEGYYKTTDNRRFSLGINLDHKISNLIKVGISSRLTHTTNNKSPKDMGSINLAYMNPLAQPFEEDGVTLRRIPSDVQATYNIVGNYYEPYKNADIILRNFNVGYIEFNFMKSLKLRSNIGIDIANKEEDEFYGKYSFNGGGKNNYGKKGSENIFNLTWDNILTYIQQFGKHNVNVSAVTSLQSETTKYSFSSGEDIPVEDLENWNLGTATSNVKIDSEYNKWAMSSFLARAQYGYDNRYLFNVAFRADGSSVLAPGNKWGVFPSVSAAWVASEEEFFNSSLISNLKMRVSYGVVGNSAISPYQTIATTDKTDYNFGNNYYYGYKLGSIVNKDLGWEYSKTFNLGADIGFWKNRLSVYVDFYRTYTSDLLMERLIPQFNGSATVWQNVGATSNTGLELAINSINIDSKNFIWRTDLNFYTNKEKIEKLITGEDMIANEWFIGSPINVFYDFQKIGIWQLGEEELAASYKRTPGEIKIKDQNNDGVVDADNDKIILGQENPKWTLFLRNSFEYKGFNFSFALEGKFGHKVLSRMLGRTVYLDGTRQIPKSVYGNYWTPDNPTNKYPNVGEAVPLDIDVIGIRKASYLNVQEISLGYNFQKIPFTKNLYLYARLKNPFFVWTADKDLNPMSPTYDLSAYKTYVIGLNVNF